MTNLISNIFLLPIESKILVLKKSLYFYNDECHRLFILLLDLRPIIITVHAMIRKEIKLEKKYFIMGASPIMLEEYPQNPVIAVFRGGIEVWIENRIPSIQLEPRTYGRNSRPVNMAKSMNVASNILTGKIIIGILVPGLAWIVAFFSVKYIQQDSITATKPIKGMYRYGIVRPFIMKSLNSRPLSTKYCIRNNWIIIVEVVKRRIENIDEADVHLKIIRLGTLLNS